MNLKHFFSYLFSKRDYEKPRSNSKIYDCFLFFNELEILKIRLEELYDSVDYFVIVECSQTFQGQKKDFFLEKNIHLFEKYKDKIIYVKIDKKFRTWNAWSRRAFQHNQVLKGLSSCRSYDLVLFSDLDEIPNHKQLPKAITILSSGKHEAVTFRCKIYRFYLNRRFSRFWSGPVICTYKTLAHRPPTQLRKNKDNFPYLPYSGWHFTSQGGHKKYLEKIRSYCHAPEMNTPANQNPENLYKRINTYELVKIDESYPKYIQENSEKLLKAGFIDFEGNPDYH